MPTLVRIALLALATGTMALACGSPSPGTTGATPGAASSATADLSSIPPPTASAIVAASATPEPRPDWASDLVGQLRCDGAVQSLGAGADPADRFVGEVGGPTLEQTVATFLRDEAPIFGYVPLDEWVELHRSTNWALWAHLVDDRPKAVALFSDSDPRFGPGPWQFWTVAACDPAEFSPTAGLNGLVVWTDSNGARVPLATLRERSVCGRSWTIRVERRVFTNGGDGAYRLRGTFADHVTVPAGAAATPYRDGPRRLWLSTDGRYAYLGTAADAERWPRIRGDDDTVTDCN